MFDFWKPKPMKLDSEEEAELRKIHDFLHELNVKEAKIRLANGKTLTYKNYRGLQC